MESELRKPLVAEKIEKKKTFPVEQGTRIMEWWNELYLSNMSFLTVYCKLHANLIDFLPY